MNEIELLEKLVSINTIQDKGNKEILDFIESYLKEYGFKTIKRSKFLIMQYGKGGVAFIGHSDTVELTEGWNTNPFELTLKDDKLYGLGSADMKGGIAAFLAAITEIDLGKLNKGVKVYITYDEEIGFNGILDVVEYEKNNINKSDLIIVGEPTYNEKLVGGKGLFGVEIKTKGIKVHSSTPDKGESAISKIIKLLNKLENFYEKNIRNEINDIYEVPYTTMNIGTLNGGSAKNSVAADANAYVDFRISRNEHIDKIKKFLNKLCIKYGATYDIDVEIKSFYNKIEFIDSSKTAGFMTEASFIDGNRVILGPGPVTAHEVNEYIEVESLRKVKEEYKKLTINVCK